MAAKQEKQAKVLAAAKCWQQVMLRKAWCTWQERAAGWADRRAKVALAAGRWHSAALSQAFQEWREGVAYAQETKGKLLAAAGGIVDCPFPCAALLLYSEAWGRRHLAGPPGLAVQQQHCGQGCAVLCCVGDKHAGVSCLRAGSLVPALAIWCLLTVSSSTCQAAVSPATAPTRAMQSDALRPCRPVAAQAPVPGI